MPEPLLYVVPIIDAEGPTTGREDMTSTWEALEAAVGLVSGECREALVDSYGQALVVSWFVMDWTGFNAEDPAFQRRGHDPTLHRIWDFYQRRTLNPAALRETDDGLYWHYHHPPPDGSWGWNTNWEDARLYEYLLARKVLDRGFFPAVYRAGKYLENNQASRWLEEWLPFDFSSIAPRRRAFYDWSAAPANWTPYHPALENYQQPGGLRRLIARSLPVAAKGGSGDLTEDDVRGAFEEAAERGKAIFSFHTHDYYKSAADEFRHAHDLVSARARASGIPWKFVNAVTALREYVTPVDGALSIDLTRRDDAVLIAASHEIFGPQPFVALEYEDGTLERMDVTRSAGGWLLKTDARARRIGVGAADRSGQTAVARLELRG